MMSMRQQLGWIARGCCLALFVLVLGVVPASASAPPSISEEHSLYVAYSTASVYASITPQGEETTFHLEYGTTTSYGSSAPVPDASAGSSSGPEEVSVSLSSLQPGTTYHYRFIATNPGGTVEGPDKTFTTFAVPAPEGVDTCPNAAYRKGPSANLPDCRSYEMVSPVEKNGGEVVASTGYELQPAVVSSASGNRAVFAARTGFGDTKGSGLGGYSEFMASRGAGGWTTKGLTPTPALNDPVQAFAGDTKVLELSSELDRAVMEGYDLPEATEAPNDTRNLYLDDTVNYKVLEDITRFEGFEESFIPLLWRPELGGSSSDMGVVAFQMSNNLVAQAKGTSPKVYVLDHGVVRLVSILPDGSLPVEASLVREQAGSIAYKDTVSPDGSRVYFYATPEGGERQLYMRKNGASTVLISESEASTPSEAQNVKFQTTTPDGTKVLFTTSTRLTDSDPGGPGVALYLYEDGPNPKVEKNLTYIARLTGGEEVDGVSEDASHIYFTSEYNEVLPFKTIGSALFLWDSGHIKQVAPEPGAAEPVEAGVEAPAIVAQDGHRIVFMNRRRLTKQASLGSLSSGSIEEMYLYDDDKETLTCVSCPQTGAGPVKGIEIAVSATGATNPSYFLNAVPRFFSRDNGRYVFFNTSEALLPQDTNNLPDAYEYNVETGKLSLLSTGTGELGTWFVDASLDGRDVFLVTRQQLNRWDPDKLDDLYDARVEGDLPEPPLPGTPCAGDACQGVPSAAPSFNTASEFNGLGNPSDKPAVKVKDKSLTRAQQLKRALAACRKKKSKHKRAICEAGPRKRYAVKKSAKRATRVGR